MDTSEIYIKMCDKAEEIQNLALEDDYGGVKEFRGFTQDGDYIWLPRQDQLQEMLPNAKAPQLNALCNFIQFWADTTDYAPFSYEILWLAFVMKEKYYKIWNGEDWKNVTAGKDS